MSLLLAIFALAGGVVIVWHYWQILFHDDTPWPNRAWLKAWTLKGVASPVLFWLLVNAGLLPGLPPLSPTVELAKARGESIILALLIVTIPALFTVSGAWFSLSMGWLIAHGLARIQGENRDDYLGLLVLITIIFIPFLALGFYLERWPGLLMAMSAWLALTAHFTVPLVPLRKLPPRYSAAIGKIKLGKFEEAEWAILRELERWEDDFEGWLLLAGLYAEHFHDLAVAEQTVFDLCAQPNITGSQVAQAMHRLADWHLKADDPVAARQALEQISIRYPGTHLDRMARIRLDQTPRTLEELRKQRTPRRFRLRPVASAPENPAAEDLNLTKEEAARRANQCVETLRRQPNDVPAREQLARLWAVSLGQARLAVEQLELLLGMSGAPDAKKAEWLAWMGGWQLKYLGDRDAAAKTFERLVGEYPQTPQGFAAQRHLNLLAMERKLRRGRLAKPPYLPS